MVRRQSDFKIQTRTTPTTVANAIEQSIDVKTETQETASEQPKDEKSEKQQQKPQVNQNGMPYQNPYKMTINITGKFARVSAQFV